MTQAEKLVACLREIGLEVQIRGVNYREDFKGLAASKTIRHRVDVGCHFLFDEDGNLAGVQSEFDGWVTSACSESIEIVRFQTAAVDGLGSRVVVVDLQFRDATHARKLLGFTEYRDAYCGRKVYVLPETPQIRDGAVVHRVHFRHGR